MMQRYYAWWVRIDQSSIAADAMVDQAEMLLRRNNAQNLSTRWVEEGYVCRMQFEAAHPCYELLHHFAEQAGIDVICRKADAPRLRLLISDMDSTMIEQECIDEMAAMLGIKDKIAAITQAAMRGELPFDAALQERVRLLQGLPASTLEEVYNTHISLMPGAQTLLKTAKALGCYCVLVSGGFTFFTAKVADALGFDAHHANQLEVADGVLSGRVVLPIHGAQAKVEALHHYTKMLGISVSETIALGDGANDLPMLTTVEKADGLAVAVHAKPAVRAALHNRLDHAALDILQWVF